jgi:hypothetical protein
LQNCKLPNIGVQGTAQAAPPLTPGVGQHSHFFSQTLQEVKDEKE